MIHRETVTLTRTTSGSTGTVAFTLPEGIAGDEILFIVETLGPGGERLEGAHAAKVIPYQAAPGGGGGGGGQPSQAWVEAKPSPTPPVDVYVRAGGLQPGTDVEVYLVHPSGAMEPLATLPVTGSGDAWGLVGLPRSLSPGSYTLALYQSNTRVAETSITVISPAVMVDKTTVRPGDVVRVTATGLGAGYSHVYHVRIAGITLATLTPDPNGRGEAVVVVPPLPSGSYTLEIVYPGSPVDSGRTTYLGPAIVAATQVNVVDGVATEETVRSLIAGLQDRVTSLENQLATLNETVAGLEEGLAGLKSGIQDLAQGLDEARENITTIAGELESHAERLNTLEKAVEGLQDKAARLDAGIASLQGELARLNETLTILANNLDKARENITQLQERLKDASMTLAGLQRSVAQLANRTIQLRQDLDKLAKEDIPGLESRITILQATLSGLEERLKDQSSQLAQLQSQLQEHAAKLGELDASLSSLGDRVGRLEEDLSSAKNLALGAIALAIVALALGGLSLARKK